MAKVYCFRYSIAMTYYDDIYELAVDNHYLITSKEAEKAGVPKVELVKLARRGKLENLSYGLYRLSRYVPSESDPYAVAIERVGSDAYLYGESVLALLGLAPTNPSYICVATPKRVRRKLPESIRVHQAKKGDPQPCIYDGVRSQRAKDAIVSCKGRMEDERLRDALAEAMEQGYVTQREADEVREAFGWR